MAGIYRGHLLEFPLIRVDCFTTARPEDVWLLPRPLLPEVTAPAPQARLHLLTHVHTDHLQGLDDAFTGRILCHPDTKRMLLRLEAMNDRRDLHNGKTEVVKRKYTGLVARRQTNNIETLPYGVPKEYDLGYYNGERCVVNITLLDANHCPGSTMFLVTAKDKAVLHTGDVRADKLFMQHLMREPVLQEFLVPTYSLLPDSGPTRRLQRIYVDTSQSEDSQDMPQKEDSMREMIYCMAQYPPGTVFFLETWCWGWEEVIIAVAKAFRTKVHLDRYKRDVYQSLSTKMMEPFITSDENVRFHACEQFFRCQTCRGKRVVRVRMGEVQLAGSELRAAAFREVLSQASAGEVEWPDEIVVPFARHSSLPELRNFVAQFQPRSLSLNTKMSDRQLYTLHEAFAGAVPDDAVQAIRRETRAWFTASPAHGPDWLMAMDLAGDMFDAADAAHAAGAGAHSGIGFDGSCLGLNLATGMVGTSYNGSGSGHGSSSGNASAPAAASLLAALLTNAAGRFGAFGAFGASMRDRGRGLAVSGQSQTHSAATAARVVKQEPGEGESCVETTPAAVTRDKEGEGKSTTPQPKADTDTFEVNVKVEGVANADVKVERKPKTEPKADGARLPSSETPRKKRRTSARPTSKYAVDAASLSKLIKREP